MENLKTETVTNNSDKKLLKIIILVVIIIFFVIAFFYFNIFYKDKLNKTSINNKMCEGVNIVFFPGGSETDVFANIVYNGARAAEKDFGANVRYVWSDWDSNKMIDQFIDTIATSPDAIAIMGHPGSDALGPFIDEALRNNIIVTSQNVDLEDIRNKYSSKGFGYVGQSVYESGLTVANAVVRKYNLKEGTEAIVFGVSPKVNPNRYLRTKGNIDGLENNNLIVHEISMPLEVEKDTSSTNAEEMLKSAFDQYPNAKVIITDHGSLTAATPSHLQKLGIKPGELIIAGFDLSADTVAGIKSGYLGLILDQQPYLQGYLPILQSCLTKKYGFAGLYIDTGTGLIDESNVDPVSMLAEEKIR